jgi:hypothetical protein
MFDIQNWDKCCVVISRNPFMKETVVHTHIEGMPPKVSKWWTMSHIRVRTVRDETIFDFFASKIKMQSANGVEAVGENVPGESEKGEVGRERVFGGCVEEVNGFGVARDWF